MSVPVAAASKHGATEEIAARIGAGLVERGIPVEVKKLRDVNDVGRYDAFVVGSGIYLGTWLKEARRFVDTHAAELAKRPTWLFASGSIVGDPPPADDPDALRAGLAEKLVAKTGVREHRLFDGKMDMRKLGLLEKTAVRGAHGDQRRLPRLARDRRMGGRHRTPARRSLEAPLVSTTGTRTSTTSHTSRTMRRLST